MKAIIRKQYGGPEQLVIEDIQIPVPSSEEVLIRVKAFGINRAEIYMRKGVWGDVAIISGIECVGEVAEDPSGKLPVGQTVAAIMGGMGRTRNGSYAEYTCLPHTNVLPLKRKMDWVELAAIPESYATAWSCLTYNMKMKEEDTLLVRGGTSALGQAAINIASNFRNVTVLATTRNFDNAKRLKDIGADSVFVENPDLSDELRRKYPEGIDGVLDIVGNSTLLDSLRMVKKDGYVCNAGFLGGGEPIQFNPLVDMPPSVNLNFFASFMFGTRNFPVSDIPMEKIIERVSRGIYKAKPAMVFEFEEISKAHILMEQGGTFGKIVVRL